MSAFVPTPGLPLKSQSSFVQGASVLASRDERRAVNPAVPVMAADGGKKPGLFKGLIEKVASVAKKSDKAAAPAPPPPGTVKVNVTSKVPVEPTFKPEVKIDQEVIDKSKAAVAAASPLASAPKKGDLPKFYNPTTARAQFSAAAAGQNTTPYDVRYLPSGLLGAVPTNTRDNPNGSFRNMDAYTDDPVWARPGWSSDEARLAARVAMRNVLGNANLFESEVEELADSISCLYQTADVKEFVRAVGLSAAYRKRFFEPVSNVRFVELNFKHFLGRAPRSQAELSEHVQRVVTEGYNAEINSHIDSEEYAQLWGRSRIPQIDFRGGHPNNVEMNKIAVLNGPYSSADTTSKLPFMFNVDAVRYLPFSIRRGLPEAWRSENDARALAGVAPEFPESFWNPVPQQIALDEVAWKMRYGSWNKYWYKDTPMYKDQMKPVLTHSEEEKKEADAVLMYGSLMAKNFV